jgi:hypothetical protein
MRPFFDIVKAWSKGWSRASTSVRTYGAGAAGLRRMLDDSFSLRAGSFRASACPPGV